jgi:hypothetical protein
MPVHEGMAGQGIGRVTSKASVADASVKLERMKLCPVFFVLATALVAASPPPGVSPSKFVEIDPEAAELDRDAIEKVQITMDGDRKPDNCVSLPTCITFDFGALPKR